MNLLKILQSVAGRCPSPSATQPEAAPADGGGSEADPMQAAAQTIRDHIAILRQAREAHAEVVSGRDKAQAELAALTAQRGSAQGRLAEKEKEIALTDAPLPEDALPEELELNRLDRHIRISRARLADWEDKVRKSEAALQPLTRDLEEAWEALGFSMFAVLLQQFRDGAAALRDAWMQIGAFGRHFTADRYGVRINLPFLNKINPIQDPKDGTLLLNLHDFRRPEKWTDGARELLADLNQLRSEIAAVRGEPDAPALAGPAFDDGDDD